MSCLKDEQTIGHVTISKSVRIGVNIPFSQNQMLYNLFIPKTENVKINDINPRILKKFMNIDFYLSNFVILMILTILEHSHLEKAFFDNLIILVYNNCIKGMSYFANISIVKNFVSSKKIEIDTMINMESQDFRQQLTDLIDSVTLIYDFKNNISLLMCCILKSALNRVVLYLQTKEKFLGMDANSKILPNMRMSFFHKIERLYDLNSPDANLTLVLQDIFNQHEIFKTLSVGMNNISNIAPEILSDLIVKFSFLNQLILPLPSLITTNINDTLKHIILIFLSFFYKKKNFSSLNKPMVAFFNKKKSFFSALGTSMDVELIKNVFQIKKTNLVDSLDQIIKINMNPWILIQRILQKYSDMLTPNYKIRYSEIMFLPLSLNVKSIWYLSHILSIVLDKKSVDDNQITNAASYKMINNIIPQLLKFILIILRTGPLVCTVKRPNSQLKNSYELEDSVDFIDSYICFFYFLQSFFSILLSELIEPSNEFELNSQLTSQILNFWLDNKGWVELVVRWCKAAQYQIKNQIKQCKEKISLSNKISSNVLNHNANKNILTDFLHSSFGMVKKWAGFETKEWLKTDLGKNIYFLCSSIANLTKRLTNIYPENVDDLILPLDMASILQGKFFAGQSNNQDVDPIQKTSKKTISGNLFQQNQYNEESYQLEKNESLLAYNHDNRNLSNNKFSMNTMINHEDPDKNNYSTAIEMMKQWNNQKNLINVSPAKIAALNIKKFDMKNYNGSRIATNTDDEKTMNLAEKKYGLNLEELKDLKILTIKRINDALMYILSWNFFKLSICEPAETLESAKKLPLTFKTTQNFFSAFYPLVIEEARCGLIKNSLELKLRNFSLVFVKVIISDEWLIVKCRSGMKKIGIRDNLMKFNDSSHKEFLKSVLSCENYFLENCVHCLNDIILLTPNSNLLQTKGSLDDLMMNNIDENQLINYLIGIIVGPPPSESDSKNDKSYCYLKFRRKIKYMGTQLNRKSTESINIESAWNSYAIGSVTNTLRELKGLSSLIMSPLYKKIINPDCLNVKPDKNRMPITKIKNFISSPLELERMQKLAVLHNLNASQFLALQHAATASDGIALLQGPPGTGKTKTLLTIIAFLLESINNNKNLSEQVKSIPNTSRSKLKILENEVRGKTKILVCAPSNAAVDEIATRILSQGLINSDGFTLKFECLRIGSEQKITREEVKTIALDCLLKKKQTSNGNTDLSDFVSQSSEKIIDIENRIKILNEKNSVNKTLESSKKIAQLIQNKKKLMSDINDQRNQAKFDSKSAYDVYRKELIENADIIFSTLSGSGSEVFQDINSIEYLIIDEAAQTVEPSAIIPLQHKVSKIILIGDPQQLPATVLSQHLKKFNYERSLFERLQQCGVDYVLLNIQYRMRNEIAEFPSKHFYKSELLSDISILNKSTLSLFEQRPNIYLPIKFFHLCTDEKLSKTIKSYSNLDEAYFIVQMIFDLLHNYGVRRHQVADANKYVFLNDIAVIAPYKNQCQQISDLIQANIDYLQQFSDEIIEVNTIDSFQGREKKYIFFSCVRSKLSIDYEISFAQNVETTNDDDKRKLKKVISQSLGFLTDSRRLNVALTRAIEGLFIVGNANVISLDSTWKALIDHLKNKSSLTRNFFVDVVESTKKNKGLNKSTMRCIAPPYLYEFFA